MTTVSCINDICDHYCRIDSTCGTNNILIGDTGKCLTYEITRVDGVVERVSKSFKTIDKESS